MIAAHQRPCMTPGCHYHIHDSPGRIQITIDLPAGVSLKTNQHEVLHLMAEMGVAAALANDGQVERIDLASMKLYQGAFEKMAAEPDDDAGGGA
ncbi:hypothetical protein D869_gp106 [Caulobacter phage CcrRogue]|uniref:Uncharacterized protein n=1 Tax=Caulobacter phage CcrRogue TaxID=2927986 RepID=K4JSS0_9CAUD|nr:hypothetical protein D869_gp106 [Caulobacter phage CcrRogue]AFU86808.1 hypothetical protein CcrRogue_gp326 [Caulobacter phage CcrRogue]